MEEIKIYGDFDAAVERTYSSLNLDYVNLNGLTENFTVYTVLGWK